jgi:hypothetical protein
MSALVAIFWVDELAEEVGVFRDALIGDIARPWYGSRCL